MPIARIQLPDGRIARVEVPEGTTPQQAEAFARRAAGQQAPTQQAQPRQAATAKTPPPSMAVNALNSLAAVGGSLWRGAAALPDMFADAGDAVTGGVANALGLQMPSGGRKFRLSDVPDRLGTPRPVAPGVELAGNLLGGLAIPMGPKASPRPLRAPQAAVRTASPARQIVNAGKNEGVRVLTSDIRPPRTFVGKIAQATGERVIGTGTGPVRQAQQAQRVAAVERFIAEHGNPDMIDETRAVATDLAKTRGGYLDTLSRAKDGIIKGIRGNVPVDRTLTKIDEQIAWLRGINGSAFSPVIAKLDEFKANLASGKTLEQIEGNRRLLGDLFADQSLASIKGDGQKALNAIYAPLRAEMGTYIRNQSGAAAFSKWQRVNANLAAMAGELDAKAFKNVLASTDTTPERVASLIFSKSPSEVHRLAANLSPAGRVRAQAAIVAKAAEGAADNGAISPQKFANAMQAMRRNIGAFFDKNEQARIDGFMRLIKATQRASEAAAAPPTGVQTALAGIYGGVGATAGLPGLAGVQSFGVMARIYESAPIRNMLAGLSKTKPASKAEAAILYRLTPQIAAIVKQEGGALSAANDRTVAAAAASNDTSNQQQEPEQPLPQ